MADKRSAPEPDAQEDRSRARRSPHVVAFAASAVNESAPRKMTRGVRAARRLHGRRAVDARGVPRVRRGHA